MNKTMNMTTQYMYWTLGKNNPNTMHGKETKSLFFFVSTCCT